ncbi:MAG: pyridoxamine 5'-phosphate oxidase family protein [Proteobacteria bacterium]|nr:pyridoxamine 5'-phosphate oxidase family protein [Pseudomonadota bacterium]MCL2307671.1 pyridoxamine 5'-phosphate oxidase family protein [Pseudomonadota bacterium]
MKITEENWTLLKQHYQKTIKTGACSIGTVDGQGMPNVTPIGSLVLTEKGRGFFFNVFCELLSRNIANNPNICVVYVNVGSFYWLKSLYKGRFVQPVGFKLLGKAGPKRAATSEEVEAFRSRIKLLKPLKGYRLLWSDLSFVRDVELTDYFPVNAGKMTGMLG